MKIYSFFSAPVGDVDDASTHLPSETIPDQSLTVQDILLRYARGDISSLPSLSGDDDDIDDDFDFEDLSDATEAYGHSMSTVVEDARRYSVASDRSKDDDNTVTDDAPG